MLTLPVLIFVGLDPITANGTNRISILLENLTATRTFYQHNLVDFGKGMYLALWTLPGAILGAIASVHIGVQHGQPVFSNEGHRKRYASIPGDLDRQG